MGTSITVPVPSSEDYTAPETAQSRIAAKWARMPTVDQNGKIVSRPSETGTVALVNPIPPPSMPDALVAAAERCGADLATLLDSDAFCASLGSISPSDSAELDAVIRSAMPPPTAPGMARNPAQGSSGSGWSPTVGSTADRTANRIHAETSKIAGQPLPPGSVQ